MRVPLILLLTICCSYVLSAQTPSPELDLSNRVVTITNLHGEQFKDIKLIKADAKGIIYVFENGAGGGRLHYINLSTATLNELGIGVDTAEKEAKLTEQEAAQEKKLYEEEKEKMRDPANYRTIHLISFATISAGAGQCNVFEFEKTRNFLIYNLPDRVAGYFKELQHQVGNINDIKNQLDQVRNKESQSASRIENLNATAAQLKNEHYRGDLAQANNPGNENYAWNVDIRHRQEQNSDNLDSAKDEQLSLQYQESQLQKSLESAQAKMKLFLDKRSGSACEVRVFVSLRKKYLGNPVLICASDKEQNESSVSPSHGHVH